MAKKSLTDAFMQSLIKASGNPMATILENDCLSNVTEWIDTGCFALNGLISSDIFKGIPNNKIICFQGEESTGKTYLMLSIAKYAIQAGYVILYFDSENTSEKEVWVKREIDPKKVIYCPVETVEQFRNELLKIVNSYNENIDKDKPKLMVILDSLGNLSTIKEIKDSEEGKNTRDMTRAQAIKSVFRTVNLKLAKAKIPMLMSNHTYSVIGAWQPTREGSGGSGPKYAASIIIDLAKKKAKDKNNTVVGVYLKCKSKKNRFCKDNSIVTIYLNYNSGLHSHYGLQDFGEGFLIKETKGWSVDGIKISEKELWKKETWTDEILKKTNKNLSEKFSFGSSAIDINETNIDEEDETKEEKEE